ncbi:SIMPL domain-containing protein [bacterium]|nr:SIMPL domain-containing protein [bacterium]
MNILENRYFQILACTLLIVLTVFIAVLINEKSQPSENNLVTITGTGEVYITPDVGVINISVRTENKEVKNGTEENNKKTNDIIAFLKTKKVEEKDIKTNSFNINPVYSYEKDTGKRSLSGYEVNQSLTVKIRDTSKVGEIIAGATERGANDIGELKFIVDDNEKIKEQAKKIAIENAKNKAKDLEGQLGVKMIKIVNYSEESYTPSISSYDAYNTGARLESSMKAVSAPEIQTGQNKIISTVTITYAIQ